MSNVLFIGLGNMGGGMAANLVKAGHRVFGHDLSAEALSHFADIGGVAVESLKDFSESIDAAITMLPAGPHVRGVYTAEDGLLHRLEKGTLLIDCSTIDVESARAVGEEAARMGFPFVDAPVSGGVAAATGGTLTFMVGGEAQDFASAKEYLDAMGKNVFHAGALGNGQVAKIANNMLLAISMIGTCEAFHLAEQLGLDPQTFYDISSTASGQSWSMTSYCPAPGPVTAAPSNRDYQPGFTAAMMLKDLRLARDAAAKSKTSTPLGAQAEALYALMEASGTDGLDFSGIMKLIDGSLKAS